MAASSELSCALYPRCSELRPCAKLWVVSHTDQRFRFGCGHGRAAAHLRPGCFKTVVLSPCTYVCSRAEAWYLPPHPSGLMAGLETLSLFFCGFDGMRVLLLHCCVRSESSGCMLVPADAMAPSGLWHCRCCVCVCVCRSPRHHATCCDPCQHAASAQHSITTTSWCLCIGRATHGSCPCMRGCSTRVPTHQHATHLSTLPSSTVVP
jgi:hypothetical protein